DVVGGGGGGDVVGGGGGGDVVGGGATVAVGEADAAGLGLGRGWGVIAAPLNVSLGAVVGLAEFARDADDAPAPDALGRCAATLFFGEVVAGSAAPW
ncbi:MAG TPA: hypothetical protein VF218_02055, partial [Acidothermaceae bacterium]